MSRPLSPARPPISWTAHRLRRSDPDRIAAEEERRTVGAARLIGPPAGSPRHRAGKPGPAGRTSYVRKVGERDRRKSKWAARVTARLAAVLSRLAGQDESSA